MKEWLPAMMDFSLSGPDDMSEWNYVFVLSCWIREI